ncbi:hypothetical protein D9M71_133930 [compost metagenome]
MRLVALALQVQHADAEYEDRADQAQPGRGPGGGVEEGGRDDVLDLWRAGQRVHGEGKGPQGNGCGDQPFGDVALAKHLGGERVDREHHHEQRNAAIGEQGADQHDYQHGLAGAEQADGGSDDGAGEAGQLDQFAEHRTEQEYREIQLDEADHFLHEHASEGGGDSGRVGQQDGAEGGDGGKQDHAVATVSSEHQQREGRQGNDYTQRVSPWCSLFFVVGCAGR